MKIEIDHQAIGTVTMTNIEVVLTADEAVVLFRGCAGKTVDEIVAMLRAAGAHVDVYVAAAKP